MLALVGLGNPDPEYFDTPHNAGFKVIDFLASKWKVSLNDTSKHSVFGKKRFCGEEILLVKPTTYMNRSGWAVREFVHKYDLPPENFFVIFDDFHLPLGNLRIRTGGSSGGHNGIQSIMDDLGSEKIPRLRIGIGSPDEDESSKDFVLAPYSDDELKKFEICIARASEAVEYSLKFSFEKAMGKYNKKLKEEKSDCDTDNS